jgi:hypothetical protein
MTHFLIHLYRVPFVCMLAKDIYQAEAYAREFTRGQPGYHVTEVCNHG